MKLTNRGTIAGTGFMPPFEHIDETTKLTPDRAPLFDIGNVVAPKDEVARVSICPRPSSDSKGVIVSREWNRQFKDWHYEIEWRPEMTRAKMFEHQMISVFPKK